MNESKNSEGGERVGNLADPMEVVEGGSTNEDVMVEVLGSDVFVDGVRSHEDDDDIDAVVSEDDGPDENNKTTDNMDIDSKLPNDSSKPLGGGESKDTYLVKDVGSLETEVDTRDKEIPDEEGGLVAETSIINVEETQLIDDNEGLVEETRVVVDEKKLINETNDEVENPLQDDDESHQGKAEVFVDTVVDASSRLVAEEGGLVAETSIILVEETQLIDDSEGLVEETRVVVDEKKLINETNDEVENPLQDDDESHRGKAEVFVDTVVDASSRLVVEEGGLVAETSIIVVEETQLIDDNEGLVEETRVVVHEKKLIDETNDEVENPLQDDDESHRGKTEVFVDTVVDASSGGPVKSSRPTGGSTAPVQEQDGSESAAADLASVEQDTPLTTRLVPNQEEEEQENVNVVNGVECHPSLVLETPSSPGKDILNLKGDSDDVSPIPEESTAIMQSGGGQADVSVLEEALTEEPSLELLAPVSVESEAKKIKEDTEGSSGVAVSHEEIQAEDKPHVEDVAYSFEEADDGGVVVAADSEQPTEIVVARKSEEVEEETISSTCAIDQDSEPEGHHDSKMDDSAHDIEAASVTCQTTESNMEVVTGSSEKVEQTQEAIEQEEEEEPINVTESKEPRPRIDDNHQEVEGGTVTTIPDHREVLETTLAEPVVGLLDNNTNDQMVVKPSQSSQPSGEIELGEPLEDDITNAEGHLVLFEHTLCESTEMDVQVTEDGECVLTVHEVVLSSSSNNDIQVVVVDNNSEYMDGSLTVNLPIDVDREQQLATDSGEKQLAAEVDMADIDETRDDTIPSEEVNGKEQVAADYDEQNGLKTETTFASYNLPQTKEDDFTVSDLVWGKVRSHPWWPGQIFDPSAASEAALKYHKKEDSYLVAYFGDRTFAWMNEASGLKSLRNNFSQLEKQSSSEAFRNAVDCALKEVSRRAQLSLTCSCISEDEKMNIQIVENDGIKEELCKREGLVDANTNTFEPDKLFEYVKELAQLPYGGADRYELAVAKAQLLSFYRLKGGFSQLPEFQDGGELVEGDTGNLNFDELSADDDDEEYSSGGGQEEEEENKPPQKGSLKRKHNLRDITYPIKKGRSMKELMSETTNNNDDDQRSSTKVVVNATTVAPPVPKPSFKIGECISRVASQLTGSSSLLKQQHTDHEDASERNTNEKEPSIHDLLSRLQVAAEEPLKEHANYNCNSSFDVFRSFFSDFRNSAVLEQNPELAKMGGGGGSKRKRPSHLDDGSTEAFEFEDMNDSYWTDRVIENGVEEELLPSDGGGAVAITTAKRLENHIVPVELKPLKTGRRPYNKRRHLETGLTSNHGYNGGLGFTLAENPEYIDPNAPAELVMIFSEFGFFPATEVSLNRMFKRFGPLRESQTELDRDSCRARVVFKKCSDAEVACSSAGRFNIFGPVHVIYQLNYTVSPEFKTAMIEDGGGHHEEDYIE